MVIVFVMGCGIIAVLSSDVLTMVMVLILILITTVMQEVGNVSAAVMLCVELRMLLLVLLPGV